MVAKYLAIWLVVLVSYGSAGYRIKRTGLKPLFSISQPPAPSYPPWKEDPSENETPSIPSESEYPDSESDIDEEDPYPSSGFGSVLSLIPGGLTGLLSLSAGSASSDDPYDDGRVADDRLGLALKKNILTTVLQKKKDLFTALKRDAVQLAIRKVQAKKAWIKNLLLGSYPGTGYYYKVPYFYPKKSSILSYVPFVGQWFGHGGVHLPAVPNLVALKDQAKYKYPYQTASYLKLDIPGKDKLSFKTNEYQVPGTSYAVPEKPVPVPQVPYYENEPPSFAQPAVTTPAPKIDTPELYPYPQQSPALPQYSPPANVEPVFPYPASYPYPMESYPYASSDYYDTAQSEIHPVKEERVYRHSEDSNKVENSLKGRPDKVQKGSAIEETVGDNTENKTETIVTK